MIRNSNGTCELLSGQAYGFFSNENSPENPVLYSVYQQENCDFLGVKKLRSFGGEGKGERGVTV